MENYDINDTTSPTEEDFISEDVDDIDYLIYDDGYIEQEPRWTRRRVIWLLIAIVIIAAMVGLLALPLLQPLLMPAPSYIPPPVTPPSQL